MAQVVESLPSKWEALNSNPGTTHTHTHTHTLKIQDKSAMDLFF
jgi:hypothetical protein